MKFVSLPREIKIIITKISKNNISWLTKAFIYINFDYSA
jgi:hypothetical protein